MTDNTKLIAEARKRADELMEESHGPDGLSHGNSVLDLDAESFAALADQLEAAEKRITELEAEGGDLNGRLSEALASVDNWREEAGIRGRQRDKWYELAVRAAAVIEQARTRLHAPIHPYGDRRLIQVPEHEFMREAYGEELPRDLLSILVTDTDAALREHDAKLLEAEAERYRTREPEGGWNRSTAEPDEYQREQWEEWQVTATDLEARAAAIREGRS